MIFIQYCITILSGMPSLIRLFSLYLLSIVPSIQEMFTKSIYKVKRQSEHIWTGWVPSFLPSFSAKFHSSQRLSLAFVYLTFAVWQRISGGRLLVGGTGNPYLELQLRTVNIRDCSSVVERSRRRKHCWSRTVPLVDTGLAGCTPALLLEKQLGVAKLRWRT